MPANLSPDHAARVTAELDRMMGIPRTPANDARWSAQVSGLRVEMVRIGAWERARLEAHELAQLEKMEMEEDES